METNKQNELDCKEVVNTSVEQPTDWWKSLPSSYAVIYFLLREDAGQSHAAARRMVETLVNNPGLKAEA